MARARAGALGLQCMHAQRLVADFSSISSMALKLMPADMHIFNLSYV